MVLGDDGGIVVELEVGVGGLYPGGVWGAYDTAKAKGVEQIDGVCQIADVHGDVVQHHGQNFCVGGVRQPWLTHSVRYLEAAIVETNGHRCRAFGTTAELDVFAIA